MRPLLDLSPEARKGIAIVLDGNPRRRLALLASRFYGAQPQTIAAVTGTNGKTSVAHFTREIWSATGSAAASLGTLGVVTARRRYPGALTTPDPTALHEQLAALAGQGISHLAIEASSHGLAQFRLDGLTVKAAAFTNLTRDHLDFHESMAAYRAAKERLFTALLGAGTAGGVKPRQRRIFRVWRRCAASAAIPLSVTAPMPHPSCSSFRPGHARAARTSCSRSSEPGIRVVLAVAWPFSSHERACRSRIGDRHRGAGDSGDRGAEPN